MPAHRNDPNVQASKRGGPLRFHGRRTDTFSYLPFVAKGASWAVPATGGYAGGTLTGEALGAIFLTVLRNNSDSDTASLWLGWVCAGWLHRALELEGVAPDADPDSAISTLRGQVIGFATALSHALREGLKSCDTPIARADLDEALSDANSGLDSSTAADAIFRTAARRAR